MDTYPPSGKLHADFHVLPVDREKAQAPKEVYLEKIWVIAGEDVWTSEVQRPKKDDLYHSLDLAEKTEVARNWPLETKINVVVRIRDAQGAAFLRAEREVHEVTP